MAGMAGFEPTNARVKVWCLTAWRHPNTGAPDPGHTEHYNMSVNILQQLFAEYTESIDTFSGFY